MDKTLYTARELADILKLHPQTIYRLANDGKIESIKVGFSRRFLMPKEGQNNAIRRKSKGDDSVSRDIGIASDPSV